MRNVLRTTAILGMAFLTSGCATMAWWSNIFEEQPWREEKVWGKEVQALSIKSYPVDAVRKVARNEISFVVANGDWDDFNKIQELVGAYFTQTYPTGRSYRYSTPLYGGKTIEGFVYRYEAGGGAFVETSVDLSGERIAVRFTCAGTCDEKLLVVLLEENTVAPLSSQAQKNYETLKSRLKSS